MHLPIAVFLSPWAINTIDKRRRAFIWCGSDSVSGGRYHVALQIVCKPWELGGLSVWWPQCDQSAQIWFSSTVEVGMVVEDGQSANLD
jgi:hypothetical protein